MEDDSSYNSEAEPDSDTEESCGLDDPEALLQTWLGELDNLKVGLDTATASGSGAGGRPGSASSVEKYSHAPRTDSYRLSMAVLEGSQDVELDAILGELCALETQFDKELKGKPTASGSRKTEGPAEDSLGPLQPVPPRKPANMGGGARPKFEVNYSSDVDWTQRHEKGPRTESPDNDSAFSDNLSMLSSESSASSGGSGGSGARTEVSKSSSGVGSAASPTSQADQAARIKAEKIKLALEKIREANVKKLFIKAFTGDGSTKSLLVDEKMSCGHVTRLLADKNHVRMEPRWAVVEYLPDLLMERLYEDHENLVDNLMLWTRDSKNQLRFQERPDKYELFARPELYLLPSGGAQHGPMDDDARLQLIEEFFSASGSVVPEVESELWLKAEGKKAWKRHHFVLRGSGIYYSPKGKVKSSKDLVCLAKFDVNQVYYGIGWKKKYKAPTDFCFAIKHPQIQVKAPKHIRYMCADDSRTLHQWMMGIRVAKHGRQLQENHRQLMDDLAQDDIDRLAHARSFSVASVAPSAGTPSREEGATIEASLAALTEQAERLSEGSSLGSARSPMRRQDSVISRCSGSSSSKSSENAFDSDHPQGTIKRKPSMAPKLPLTSTTRLLVKPDDAPDAPPADAKPTTPTRQPGRRSAADGESLNGTLTRRRDRQASDTLRSTGSGRSIDSRSDSLRSSSSGRSADSRSDSLRSSDSGRSVDTVRARPAEPPLPPPPPAEPAADSDSESLPPPPEMSGSLLSLASLPPPPEELMPPPPASPRQPDPPRVAALPPRPPARRESPPPAELAAPLPPPMPNIEPIYGTGGQKRVKKISFADTAVVVEPPQPPSPQSPAPQPVYARGRPPPPPPKRSETTRLSSGPSAAPNRLDSPQCSVTPPRDFLRDLQRVMHKKWTVAEKCKVDLKSPHEVLGFRDPFATMDANKEQHVGQWLAQHYGGGADEPPPPAPAGQPLYDTPRSVLKKRPPPPPPPRRNDATQLSGRR